MQNRKRFASGSWTKSLILFNQLIKFNQMLSSPKVFIYYFTESFSIKLYWASIILLFCLTYYKWGTTSGSPTSLGFRGTFFPQRIESELIFNLNIISLRFINKTNKCVWYEVTTTSTAHININNDKMGHEFRWTYNLTMSNFS